MTRGIQLVLIVSLTWLLAGCGSNDTTPDTHPVTGKVTLDGAPLPSGRIIFENVENSISNSAEVVNGEFSGQVAAGDLKARVVRIEKIKSPMGDEEIDNEIALKSDIPVTIKAGSNTLPPIEAGAGAP